MMELPREMCKEAHLRAGENRFDLHPIQLGLGGSPWRVGIASILLNRTRRSVAEPILRDLLFFWSTPETLARADGLVNVIRSLGFQNRRATVLTSFSVAWLTDEWRDFRDLPGVGTYVADAVGLCIFGCPDLESNDIALTTYRDLRCAGDAGLSV